jgi:hypothetical protein
MAWLLNHLNCLSTEGDDALVSWAQQRKQPRFYNFYTAYYFARN